MSEAPPVIVDPVPEEPIKSDGNGGDNSVGSGGGSKPVKDVASGVSKDDSPEHSVTKPSIKLKKKKQGTKFNYRNAAKLEQQVQMNLVQNELAHKHYQFRQYWFFTVPQAFLTAVASVLAFAASAEMFQDNAQYISLFVGSVSAAVVLFQTISGIRQYGVKADRHQSVSTQLRDLRDDLIITKFKLHEVEKETKNKNTVFFENVREVQNSDSGGGGDVDIDTESDSNNDETFQEVQKRFQTCLSGCTSVVPMAISEAFHGVLSNLEIAETKNNIAYLNKLYGHTDYALLLETKACDILAGEIVNSPLFPMKIPNSALMVNRTMTILKNRLKEQANFYDDVALDIEKPRTSLYGGRFSVF